MCSPAGSDKEPAFCCPLHSIKKDRMCKTLDMLCEKIGLVRERSRMTPLNDTLKEEISEGGPYEHI